MNQRINGFEHCKKNIDELTTAEKIELTHLQMEAMTKDVTLDQFEKWRVTWKEFETSMNNTTSTSTSTTSTMTTTTTTMKPTTVSTSVSTPAPSTSTTTPIPSEEASVTTVGVVSDVSSEDTTTPVNSPISPLRLPVQLLHPLFLLLNQPLILHLHLLQL